MMGYNDKWRCPFCGGSGVTPFVGRVGQKCDECKETGVIAGAAIRRYGIESFVPGYKKPAVPLTAHVIGELV